MKKKTKDGVKVTYKSAKKPAIVAEPIEQAQEQIQEPVPIPEVVETQPVKQSMRNRFPINRYWALVGLAVGVIVLSIVIGSIWLANPTSQILGLITVALFIGGAWLSRRQFKHRHDIMGDIKVNIASTKTTPTGEKATSPAVSSNGHADNSLNFYAYKNSESDLITPNRIAFEYTENPLGQPQKCLNTGKYYYVHIWDIDKEELVPFMLPDSKFTDPAILARYLGLPAQKKYLRHRESLMHYIGPGILALMCAGGFIAIIALSG